MAAINFRTDIQEANSNALWNKVDDAKITYTDRSASGRGFEKEIEKGNTTLIPESKRGEGFEQDFILAMEIFRSFLETIQSARQANIVHECFSKMLAGIADNTNAYVPPVGEKGEEFDVTIAADTAASTATTNDSFDVTVYSDDLFPEASKMTTIVLTDTDNTIDPTNDNFDVDALNNTTDGLGSIQTKNGDAILQASVSSSNVVTFKTTEAGRGSIIVLANKSGTPLNDWNISTGTYIPPVFTNRATNAYLDAVRDYLGQYRVEDDRFDAVNNPKRIP